MPGIEVLIVDDDGTEVPAGEAGEVVVRGYNVMAGYFENPEATAETIDPDGWLHTGDIGVMDERGYLRITDRKKDLFIVGGFNAYPAEIERILLGHEAVAQAAVVGVPDEMKGQQVVAFVVARPGAERLQPPVLVAAVTRMLGKAMAPSLVHVVDGLPKTKNGKIMRRAIRARYLGEKPGDLSAHDPLTPLELIPART